MEKLIDIDEDGSVRIPADLLRCFDLLPGDAVRIVETDGALVLIPKIRSVTELAEIIDRARREAGLEMDDLLASLREERTRYVAETYGIGAE